MSVHRSLALEAAIAAGRVIMEIYDSGEFEVQLKSDESPLTKADLAAHHAIKECLAPSEIPILSEEGRHVEYSQRSNWKSLWIIDPIDGTKEFIKRNGEFTVNIALVDDGIPTLGVVLVPALGQLFIGDTQNGARWVEHGDLNWSPSQWLEASISIPMERGNRPFTVVASRSHMSEETDSYIKELREIHGEIELISKGSSLKLCMVAAGIADCYPRFAPTMEWDTAAGQAVCLAAQCEVLDWNTQKPLMYNREELLNPWFLVRKA
ncbi:MAG: 3'(2'),5'-bisphosphate nucleotidase CysQ [Bacteroidetes bacterium]|nr:3'(2'),5'-bisphosphate nucleotidase CysQ [Bacteroidota bacterium]MDA1335667.1 3'(2'),5'-bisphosphate nucleotidase CysQ [Bacteroidota bacterium]